MAWFLAQLRLPANTTFTYNLDPTTRAPVATTFTTTDGSWARVEIGLLSVIQGEDVEPGWRHSR